MEWRPVIGYEELYEVSECGGVRRVGADRLGRRTNRGAALKPWLAGTTARYLHVHLSKNGHGQKVAIHRLVAAAFLGPRTTGRRKGDWQVNHRDGNTQNNDYRNLEYVTVQGNHDHAVSQGLTARGERNARAKLTEAIVRDIRAAVGTVKQIAVRFGVSEMTAYRVRRRLQWGHVA
jgi:hypothetical protein